jgi:diguanylate cyclase (GGDEF)-like protein/PAS domain S-box-containing protein
MIRSAFRVRRSSVWAWYLAITGALTACYLFVPSLAGNGPLINGLGLSGVVAIVVGIRIHRPAARLAWWLFALGQFLFFAGDLYTYSYPKLFGADVGFPSLGDALYLAVYPVLLAGVFVLVRRRNPRRDRSALIDSLILTIGAGLLSWVFLIAPNIHLTGLSPLAQGVSIAYPLGDVLLLAGMIRLSVDSGKRAPAFYLLSASIVCLLATDSAYNYALLKNTYDHQLIYDAGWILYYLLWGAAALHPSMRELSEPAAQQRTRLTPIRLALLGGACLIAPGIRFWQELGNPDVLVVIGASAVLFLLVVSRMAGLVRQEARLVSHEQALRRAGIDLVAAAGHDQVYAAAISGMRTLAGAETAVRLALLRDEGASVVASSEDESWELDISTEAWLRSRAAEDGRARIAGVPDEVRSQLRLEDSAGVAVLPLVARSELFGVIAVACGSEVGDAVADSLASLARQVALALEAATLAADVHERRSAARFRSLVAHSSDLITVLDANGIVTYQSPSVERVLGYRVHEIEGTRFDWILSENDRPRLRQLIAGDGGGLRDAHTFECSFQHHDGSTLRFEVQHTDLLADEHVHGIVLNSRDISERKAFEEQLAHQAFHDPVTGLANRALFSDRVEHALMRGQRGFPDVAVMFVDLDDFKTVNDSLGHAAGDDVLREVASRLRNAVRPTDTVARFGGDEFAILLEGITDSTGAADSAARVLTALETSMEIDGKQVFPRASIGICLVDRMAEVPDAAELLRNADVAMYMAKRDSKGSYRVFEPTMHERVVERLELRAELQRAIESDQLELYYQPVVRLAGHDILGVEALLRWKHPERGVISPAHFIPLAEESGLIISMGRWVLEHACREAVELQRLFPRPEPITMSVNLSVRQLQSDSIVADVRRVLAETGLTPTALVLEITESVMLADTDFAVSRLIELKSLGVRLAMDDFGTGYSSLSYLSRFPVDILKMDRSFIGSGENPALTSAILALGASLDLDVVAEGIEREEQEASLTDLGCEIGQGFLYARPMPAAELGKFLAAHPAWADGGETRATSAA